MLLPTARLADLFANGGTGEPLLFQNFQSSIMSVWLLCALLSSVVCQTEQDGHSCSIKDVKVNAEETDTLDNGVWVLNVAWRDELKAENNESRKVSYDIKVYRTESMTTVYDETILVTPDNTALYHWNWTSPIPLQCTSHSVRLRRRDQHHIGEWTPLYTYKGQDLNAEKVIVFPRSEVFAVGSNITFCCILEKGKEPLSDSPFLIPISNRTYITKPVHFDSSSGPTSSISCDSGGTSVLIGYPPDDHSLTCETSDFSSVNCRWETGRKTRLDGSRKTVYKLNGRACLLNECELPAVPNQVTNWTLIAKNPLGVKTLTDTADPTHRVCLRAPSKVSHTAYARSVTLQWHWNVTRYASFRMTCQVMLNENTYNKTFHGLGLSLIVLDHLQPFAKYTVKVRCGSDEHFYKWGDWSDIIEFSTKEDIPETVDIWVQYFEQNTYVLWKPLTQQQSHGIITQYELAIGNRTEIIDIGLNTQMCYNITTGNERSDRNITMSAKNSAGLSPPSTIIVSGYHDNEVNIGRISSRNGGFDCLVWDEYFNSTCGYIIEWFPTYNETQCAVEWTKIPEYDHAACHTWKQKGIFKEGVKYTVSVYACIEDKPMLWKRSEGYAVEQKPSGIVHSLKGKQNGKNLELSWDEVPLQQQKGFIQGYTVKTFHSGSKIPVNTTVTKEPRVNLILDPGSYTFSVSAFTSGGEGDSAAFSMDMEKNIGQMTAATVAATLVFIIIAVLCYRKRKWLKKVLYPDIPEPKLAGKWTTKGIYYSQMTEGFMKCEIQEVHSSQCPHDLDLISSNSTVFPAQYFYQNISECPGDVSYYPPPWACAQKLTSIIENPSYDMTISEPVDVARKSEFTLEMQESYLPAPNFVQRDFVPEPVDVSQKSEHTLEMEDSYLPAPNFVLRDFVPDSVDVAQISEHTLEMQDSYLPAPIFVQKDFVVKDSSGYKPQSA